MKIKSFFVAALIMASTVSLVAADAPSTGIAVVPGKVSEIFKVIYKSENAGKVKVNLYNANAKMIMSETFTNVDGFILPINFKGLEYGEYTIEVIDAQGKKSEKVTYAPFKSNKVVHVTKLSGEGKYLLSVVRAANERVIVKIYNAKDELIHRDAQTVEGDFAVVYKLDNKSTSYTFELADSNGTIKTIQF